MTVKERIEKELEKYGEFKVVDSMNPVWDFREVSVEKITSEKKGRQGREEREELFEDFVEKLEETIARLKEKPTHRDCILVWYGLDDNEVERYNIEPVGRGRDWVSDIRVWVAYI